MKKVLLTGASGFVGSHMLKYILEETDWEVVCLNTFKHNGIQDRISWAVKNIDENFKRVKVIICDLSSSISSITSYKIGKIDYVINVASESHVDRSILNPTPFIINNVSLICNLLDWARFNNIEKFIQVSTDEIYGPYQNRINPEWDPHLPSNPYSASKAAQEDIAFAYWRTYEVPIAITNTMNMFGEVQHVEKYTPMIIKKILNNEKIIVHTYNNNKIGTRSWLYVGNQASALLHILNNPISFASDVSRLDRWNIPGEADFNNLEWAKKIAEIMNKKIDIEFKDSSISRPGYDSAYKLDSTKILNSGWVPKFKLENVLDKTVEWYMNNKEWLY